MDLGITDTTTQPWWFRVEKDHGHLKRNRMQPWWNGGGMGGPRRGGYRESHKGGYARFELPTARNQRVIVVTDIGRHAHSPTWARHGWYLQREGAQQEGQGLGFDAQSQAVKLPKTLASWQRDHDPHLFKIVLGPNHPTKIDLQSFTQKVMGKVEKVLDRPLQWVAIDHYNTAYPHVHICLRGKDRDGQSLFLAKDFLWGGSLARLAGELLTQELGWRLAPEIEANAQRAVVSRRWGQHDKSLLRKLDQHQEVQEHSLTDWEKQRLAHLEERKLAWRTPQGWQLSYRWKEKMMMENERQHQQERQQDRAQEKRQDRQLDEKEQDREKEREAAEERQRKVRVIDQLEQGWGR
jgi:type IV secretory pathway VirD2 relaxase